MVFGRIDNFVDGRMIRGTAEVGGGLIEAPTERKRANHVGIDKYMAKMEEGKQLLDSMSVVFGATNREENVGGLTQLLDQCLGSPELLDFSSENALMPYQRFLF